MGGGGALDTWRHLGRPVWGRHTISMAASNERRDGNAYDFAPIVVLSDDAYVRGVDRLRLQGGWGGSTKKNGGWHAYFRRN